MEAGILNKTPTASPASAVFMVPSEELDSVGKIDRVLNMAVLTQPPTPGKGEDRAGTREVRVERAGARAGRTKAH